MVRQPLVNELVRLLDAVVAGALILGSHYRKAYSSTVAPHRLPHVTGLIGGLSFP